MPLILIYIELATVLAQLSCELNNITYVSGLSPCGEQSHQCSYWPTCILYKVKVNDAMKIIYMELATVLAQLSCELNNITYVSGLSPCGEQSHQCSYWPTCILYKVKVNDAMKIAKKKPKQPKIFLFSPVNRVQLLLLPSPLLLRFTPKK